MAYIDKDKLAEMINARAEMLVDGKQTFYYIANWLDKLPAADVVEVVRCKDCEYWQKYENTAGAGYCMYRELSFEYGNERKFNPVTMPNFYCSYGKRKEVD